MGEEFERDANRDISQADGRLAELQQAAEDKTRALAIFREKNKLMERPAEAADADKRWVNGGLLLVMTLLEGGANAFLFSEGRTLGYADRRDRQGAGQG